VWAISEHVMGCKNCLETIIMQCNYSVLIVAHMGNENVYKYGALVDSVTHTFPNKYFSDTYSLSKKQKFESRRLGNILVIRQFMIQGIRAWGKLYGPTFHKGQMHKC
jgi:hypothetical protein